MFKPVLLLLIVLHCSTCGSSNSADTPMGEARAAIEERLILELSPEDNRMGRERNALINYAIDEVWDVELSSVGYLYQVVKMGSGDPLEHGDYVKGHYSGRFLDGQVFDNSRLRGRPLSFYVGQMVPAWNDALLKVKPGGSLRLLVPSGLAYGGEGLITAGGDTLIPPHTPLVFEIDGLEVIQRWMDR